MGRNFVSCAKQYINNHFRSSKYAIPSSFKLTRLRLWINRTDQLLLCKLVKHGHLSHLCVRLRFRPLLRLNSLTMILSTRIMTLPLSLLLLLLKSCWWLRAWRMSVPSSLLETLHCPNNCCQSSDHLLNKTASAAIKMWCLLVESGTACCLQHCTKTIIT